MNKNYYSNGIMRRMRQFTHDMTVNAHSKDKDIERLRKLKRDDEITQTVYDRELSAIQEGIKAQTVKVKTECKKDLMGGARRNAPGCRQSDHQAAHSGDGQHSSTAGYVGRYYPHAAHPLC